MLKLKKSTIQIVKTKCFTILIPYNNYFFKYKTQTQSETQSSSIKVIHRSKVFFYFGVQLKRMELELVLLKNILQLLKYANKKWKRNINIYSTFFNSEGTDVFMLLHFREGEESWSFLSSFELKVKIREQIYPPKRRFINREKKN